MNIKVLLFYCSLFINRNERKEGVIYVSKKILMETLNKTVKKGISVGITKSVKLITKKFKENILNYPVFNSSSLFSKSYILHEFPEQYQNDIFILNMVKTAID
jgi:hypothetical protein